VRNKILTAAVLFFVLAGGLGAGSSVQYKAAPRIVTPDGNNSNDRFYIFYNLLADTRISGKIFNLLSMKMTNFRNVGGAGSSDYPDPEGRSWEGYLYWDVGSAPSGIYIWQIESGNEIYTGTVVVAR